MDKLTAHTFPDGEVYSIFAAWEKGVKNPGPMIQLDAGRNITFVRLVARKK